MAQAGSGFAHHLAVHAHCSHSCLLSQEAQRKSEGIATSFRAVPVIHGAGI